MSEHKSHVDDSIMIGVTLNLNRYDNDVNPVPYQKLHFNPDFDGDECLLYGQDETSLFDRLFKQYTANPPETEESIEGF